MKKLRAKRQDSYSFEYFPDIMGTEDKDKTRSAHLRGMKKFETVGVGGGETKRSLEGEQQSGLLSAR